MNVYCHIPFCRSKCGYCAFYSLPGRGKEEIDLYCRGLLRDLEGFSWPTPAETVYFGGGTPTLADPEMLCEMISVIPRLPDAEVSIESNPETLSKNTLSVLKGAFNRLSLGVQSFDDSLRVRLGRDTSREAIQRALAALRRDSWHFNIDLIYNIPGQTREMFRRDLELAADSGAEHISCYALTPEEGTALAAIPVDDDLAESMWEDAGELLGRHGFERYEVSNYARGGSACRHNVNVWRGGILYGFGATASSFDGRDRYSNSAALSGCVREYDPLEPEARAREIFAINLRTAAGWTPELWRPFQNIIAWKQLLEEAQNVARRYPGTLIVNTHRIRPTTLGLAFWDTLATELL